MTVTPVDPSIVSNDIMLVNASTLRLIAVLDLAYNAVVSEQLLDDSGGEETLTFSLPINDPKAALIQNEMCVRVTHYTNDPSDAPYQVTSLDAVFTVRTLTQGYDESGTKVFTVYCEARWYDLTTDDLITVQPAVPDAVSAMTAILAGTDWGVGAVTVPAAAGNVAWGSADLITPLAALRSLPALFGGELFFDTVNRQVSLIPRRGDQAPHLLYIRAGNMSSDIRTISTTQLVTRVHPLGANNIDIAPVNGGVPYLEDYSYFDTRGLPRQVRAQAITNDQISDPQALLAWAQNQLLTLAQPQYTYAIGISLIAGKAIPRLGDLVRVNDETLSLDTYARVSRRDFDTIQPWLTTLTVDTAAYTLATPGGGGTGLATGSTGTDNTIPEPPTDLVLLFGSGLDPNGNWNTYGVAEWTAPTGNTDGTPISDFDHYDVQILLAGQTIWQSVGATSDPSAGFGYVIAETTIQVRVRAVDHTYNRSSWLTGSALVPLPTPFYLPPSTPVLNADELPLCILVIWDGLDNNHVPYPHDVDTIEVHVGVGTGTFTPDSTTLWTTAHAQEGGFTIPVTGLTAGIVYTFALVAVGRLSTRSLPSVEVSSQVQAIGPTHQVYNGDQDNLLPDGSFETIAGQARILTDPSYQSCWSFVSNVTAPDGPSAIAHGTYALMGTGGTLAGSTRRLVLVNVLAQAGQKLWAKCRYWNNSTGGTVTFGFTAYTAAGDVIETSGITLPGNGSYDLAATNYSLPSNCSSYDFFVQMDGSTSGGHLYLDAVELRSVIQTAIIDALAVTDAQIASASISKLTAGSLTAYTLLSNSIHTGTSYPYLDMNSTGLFAWNAAGVNTVAIRANGSADFTGTITGSVIVGGVVETALTGRRIVLDPTAVGLLEFYGGSVNEAGPALINANAIGVQPVLVLASPQAVGYGGQSLIELFPDQGAGDYVAVVTHNQVSGGVGGLVISANISQIAGTSPWTRGPAGMGAGTWNDTTDASGYITVTGIGFTTTPGAVLVTGLAPIGGAHIASSFMADSFTSSTFRVRCFDGIAGTVLASTNVTFSYLLTT